MPPPIIKKIEIQGFRAFGKIAQSLDFNSLIACIWGANSQGKTSLAEAFEFVLTGEIVRRDLLASAQDEFAEALRNVHMPKELPVFAQVTLDAGGQSRTVKRTLSADYGKKESCKTVLEIDGAAASEGDLAGLGIILSQPPLRAPVLAQHTLGYLFSARPQDRATYFRALLEVTDLETFRASVASLSTSGDIPQNRVVTMLAQAATNIESVRSLLQPLLNGVPSVQALATALNGALAVLISAEGQTVPPTLEDRLTVLETILAEKRTRTFPIRDFDHAPFGAWTPDVDSHLSALATYVAERGKVDEETRRLIAFFAEALALPHVKDAAHPIDCPLCTTAGALTPARIDFIRQRVKDTAAFRAAETAAEAAIDQLERIIESVLGNMQAAIPRFITFSGQARRERGFRMARIRALLGADAADGISSWIAALLPMLRAWRNASRFRRALLPTFKVWKADLNAFADADALRRNVEALRNNVTRFAEKLTSYVAAEEAVSSALKTVIDAESQTTGWQELIDVARNQTELRRGLIEAASHRQVQRELTQALRQVDQGNEKVLDEKFQALSTEIATWWDLLRPDGVSFFASLRPRPGTRRTIDFKAGLSVNDDRSDPTLRDVIAVFSQSQLHCLGLALFLARSIHEKTKFIVLDDPILSSDEDYRAHFNSAVLERLITAGVQVILLTQDQKTYKDLTERYLHAAIDTFQINMTSPADGTSVVNKADDLGALMQKADVLIRGGHPDLHKQGGEVLRDAAERFCKEVLVKDRRAKGDGTAAISDYDGKTLGEIGPRVEPLMTSDPSHPGKLRTIGTQLNPANHDDDIPGAATLKVALGDLRTLRRTYL
jgi:hypothetical protein